MNTHGPRQIRAQQSRDDILSVYVVGFELPVQVLSAKSKPISLRR